jgi:hypothetical protein
VSSDVVMVLAEKSADAKPEPIALLALNAVGMVCVFLLLTTATSLPLAALVLLPIVASMVLVLWLKPIALQHHPMVVPTTLLATDARTVNALCHPLIVAWVMDAQQTNHTVAHWI